MSLTITDSEMTSTVTQHIAAYDPDAMWGVTWLPGRALDRNAAITAMTIAEMVIDPEPYGKTYALLLNDFASELGLTGEKAVELVLAPLNNEPTQSLGELVEDDCEDGIEIAVTVGVTGLIIVSEICGSCEEGVFTRLTVEQARALAARINAVADDAERAVTA